MADYSISISNSIDVFGAGPASLWGTVVGGTDNWGEGSTPMTQYIGKFLSNDITPSDDFTFGVMKNVSDDISLTDALIEETLKDGKGYNYIFTSNKTDAEDRWLGTWSDNDPGDKATYTSNSGASTNWTEI